jgi:ketosteroid isomerase-like protein
LTDPPNLALVRSIYAGWHAGDYSATEWAHPEIEYVVVGGPDPGASKRIDGITKAFRDMLKAWSEWRVTADDYVEVDRERILVPYHFTGRGRASGLDAAQLHTQGAKLFHVRAGKLTRFVVYWDRERAFADVGLTPEGDP